ncbi:hypothetical protein BLA15945_05077 [Burkholderia lata]|uniref:Uncharacterized protein n=1 Tax=Burkholderia lata (strain ATCC 17760 / DSM 23089 / LMG 22485 / NCIMB 9086 / R18194 / 383) TaxID=482957 RepID=A0A6P2PB15_BURL3|nr:hypothetical protein BLA15945_05077 [Burkholderia lata]
MWADRAGIGRFSPAGRAASGFGPVVARPAGGRPRTRPGKDEKKGTVGAKRRRARMENPGRRVRRGPSGPDSGQKRVRMPDVSSSWFFAPNVDDTV